MANEWHSCCFYLFISFYLSLPSLLSHFGAAANVPRSRGGETPAAHLSIAAETMWNCMPSEAKVAVEDKAEPPLFTVGFFYYLKVQRVRAGAFPKKVQNKTKTMLCVCNTKPNPRRRMMKLQPGDEQQSRPSDRAHPLDLCKCVPLIFFLPDRHKDPDDAVFQMYPHSAVRAQ